MASLDSEIEGITSTLDDFNIISSISVFGKQTASMILAEIGDIHNFEDARKLVAFAGIDPGVFSSGRFTASLSRISKRGSRQLRHTIFLAAQCSIRGNINLTLRSFYEVSSAHDSI
ncbi:transposase [Evansella halocellulosilytica]|uniref:transposase n=1 Tax=Evansella halocellulosilytica TaxID=2011013 RepID=UPI00115538AD|nr:transposase [Evansella halocellulosilytica]